MPMSGRHRLSRLPSSLARGKRPRMTSSSSSDARRRFSSLAPRQAHRPSPRLDRPGTLALMREQIASLRTAAERARAVATTERAALPPPQQRPPRGGVAGDCGDVVGSTRHLLFDRLADATDVEPFAGAELSSPLVMPVELSLPEQVLCTTATASRRDDLFSRVGFAGADLVAGGRLRLPAARRARVRPAEQPARAGGAHVRAAALAAPGATPLSFGSDSSLSLLSLTPLSLVPLSLSLNPSLSLSQDLFLRILPMPPPVPYGASAAASDEELASKTPSAAFWRRAAADVRADTQASLVRWHGGRVVQRRTWRVPRSGLGGSSRSVLPLGPRLFSRASLAEWPRPFAWASCVALAYFVCHTYRCAGWACWRATTPPPPSPCRRRRPSTRSVCS